MSKADRGWKVLPHLPIEKVADNLWRVQGALENMNLKRVMTLARLSDGRLVIHNGIALGESEMAQIEAWGEPAFLVVPNGYHRLDAAAFVARYPEIVVLCPSGARRKVEAVVVVDGGYADLPEDPSVELRALEGVGRAEGVMIVRSADGVTLVFNDLLFNMPHGHGASGFIFRYLTASTGGPRVSRVARWFVIKDKQAVARELEALASTPKLVRIIVSHHRMIEQNAAQVLRQVALSL